MWEQLIADLAPHGVTAVAVSLDDDPEAARPWIDEAGLTFPSVIDVNHRTRRVVRHRQRPHRGVVRRGRGEWSVRRPSRRATTGSASSRASTRRCTTTPCGGGSSTARGRSRPDAALVPAAGRGAGAGPGPPSGRRLAPPRRSRPTPRSPHLERGRRARARRLDHPSGFDAHHRRRSVRRRVLRVRGRLGRPGPATPTPSRPGSADGVEDGPPHLGEHRLVDLRPLESCT